MWAIKLGSAGRCISFCEERGIVGLGWRMIEHDVLTMVSSDALWAHVNERCPWYSSTTAISQVMSQLWRFAHEFQVGHIVVYYDPSRKDTVFCRVDGDLERRRSHRLVLRIVSRRHLSFNIAKSLSGALKCWIEP